MDLNAIFAQIDCLFGENRAKEAEQYMLQTLEDALTDGDSAAALSLLNELIGYYRQTSEADSLREIIDKTLALTEQMGLCSGTGYATTLLNVATGYRSIGELQEAENYYAQVEALYQKELSAKDLRRAGFYNNFSLLKQEQGDFLCARQLQKKALDIALENQAGYEIATSYANLANTSVALRQFAEAENFAGQALQKFEEMQILDAHYCAALSALGLCRMEEKRYKQAEEYFLKGMETIENYIGRNAQYERMRENLERCRELQQNQMTEQAGEEAMNGAQTSSEQTSFGQAELRQTDLAQGEIKGLALSRKYYEEVGAPMLRSRFPEYLDCIAVGLAGEGSDCMGLDDVWSRDHDWGPDFCIWVSEETNRKIGDQLREAYEALPREFMGYQRNVSAQGRGRRGVMTIEGFYQRLLGVEDLEHLDYTKVEEYALAAATNGEVFADPEGTFSAIRRRLQAGYPESVRFLKLAEDAAKFAQCGEYNYGRMQKRGDDFTANALAYDAMKHAMRLLHHIRNCYVPHDKWLRSSTLRLEGGEELVAMLDAIAVKLHAPAEQNHTEGQTGAGLGAGQEKSGSEVETQMEEVGEFLARLMYAESVISDIDFYLDAHTDELLRKAQYARWTDEELVEQIVKLEFTAFDKVQNEGGRASCQNNWPTFSIMRKSQYLTWNRTMLLQYLYDFNREFALGHNLITEKYGRMMESTANERYEEMKQHFPEIGEQKKAVIEQIVALQMVMMEAFAEEHPNVASNARSLHTYEDNIVNTSYETYLRGEISTYSDKMLELYGRYVVQCAAEGKNIARMTIENTAKLYGYETLEQMEKGIL